MTSQYQSVYRTIHYAILILQVRMHRWSWTLLLVPLLSITADAVYTQLEISNIVRELAMSFRSFPGRNHVQYGFLLILPADHLVGLHPDARHVANYNADVLLGNNYAVARTRRGRHTEPQLINLLPQLLQNYRAAYSMDPPAVLLYTRGTPCSDCTNRIAVARHNVFPGRRRQFIVAYSTNMNNNYMTPTINCENRNLLREHNFVEVYCVPEPGTANQCLQGDTVPCDQHNRRYG